MHLSIADDIHNFHSVSLTHKHVHAHIRPTETKFKQRTIRYKLDVRYTAVCAAVKAASYRAVETLTYVCVCSNTTLCIARARASTFKTTDTNDMQRLSQKPIQTHTRNTHARYKQIQAKSAHNIFGIMLIRVRLVL